MKKENIEKKCQNCVGFDTCACYRRPSIVLYLVGPRFVGADDKCWKFKAKALNSKTR